MERATIAVIPAAGFGTRFLPATKTVPKELLPIIERPAIEFIFDDIAGAEIPEVVLVTSPSKSALAAHFSPSPELEAHLKTNGSEHFLKRHQALLDKTTIKYATQERQLGLGHAVLQSEPLVGDRPFAVLLPDDIIIHGSDFLTKMIDVSSVYGSSVLALKRVPRERVSQYGIVSATEISPNQYKIHEVVEKPRTGNAPSDLAIIGRYVLSPTIFNMLRSTQPGALGEIQLTDGITQLINIEPVYGLIVEEDHYDVGSPHGMLFCALSLALKQPSMRLELERIFNEWTG
jgi:UTP--glucose-1-phosphate uridylyltransferase